MAVCLICADLGFHFPDPLVKALLDLRYSVTLTQVSSLVEMLKIRLQLKQELVGKAMAHDGLIFYIWCEKCKITRVSAGRNLGPALRMSLPALVSRRRPG